MEKKSIKPTTMLCPLPVIMASCGTMEESNIITIEEKCTPWNSKAYNMNQTNLKK